MSAAANGQQTDETPAAAIAGERPPAVGGRADVVSLQGGGRLVGTVLAMESGGRLHLKGSAFQGEVVVAAAEVTAMSFGPAGAPGILTVPPAGPAEVVLMGGDRLHGTVAAVTPETVVLDYSAGRLPIPRRAVRCINLVPVGEVLLASAFETGKLAPWRNGVCSAYYSFEGDKVAFFRRLPSCGSTMPVMSAGLVTDEAFTVEARMRPGIAVVRMGVGFGGEGGGVKGWLTTGETPAYSLGLADGQTEPVAGSLDPSQVPPGSVVLRLTYDPAAGKAVFWLDSTRLAEIAVPPTVARDKTVTVGLNGPAVVEYARVLRGVAPPGALVGTGPAPAPGETRVEFANGDRVHASEVALADGRATLATGCGEVRCDAGVVTRIVFGCEAAAERAPSPAQDLVEGAFGRLSLRLMRMTADELIGRSEDLGEIHLRREGLGQVKFASSHTP